MTVETPAQTKGPPPLFGTNLGLLVFVVIGGPVAWYLQLTVNYGLVSHPCFPHFEPQQTYLPGWAWVGPVILVFNLLAIVAALAAALLALRLWRQTRAAYPPVYNQLLPPAAGRTRFLSVCGILTGFGSVAATVFDLIALFAVPPCLG
jgi:hypothetical protein